MLSSTSGFDKPRHYRRDGTPYLGEDAVLEWARDFETVDRVVGKTVLDNGLTVSTVWLGIDHSWGVGPPLIFETMVFPTEDTDDYQLRYSTEEEAIAGHAETVEKFRDWVRSTP